MDESRMDQLERRLDDLEDRRSMSERSRTAMSSVVPPEAMQHLRAAGREQLLFVRTLLDHWIGRLRDEPERPETSRENIRID